MTRTIRFPKETLDALRIEDVQLYLVSRGWQVEPSRFAGLANLYRLPSLPDAEVLVPTDRGLADYPQRMAEAVLNLAAVEQRSEWEVLNDLSGPPADVLRIAVSSPSASLGTMPLDQGLEILKRGRELLNAAACHVHHPQPYYSKLYFKEADAFLASCRLAQTERNGAFIARIAAPIPPLLERQPELFDSDGAGFAREPFPRQVTWRLMHALQTVNSVVESGRFASLLSALADGVTANLCESLAGMLPDEEQAAVKLTMSWSRNRPTVPATVASQVRFAQAARPILRSAAEALRDRGSPRPQEVQGHIVTLHATNTLLEGFDGQVDLATDLGRVRVLLPKADYQRACDAHKDGQRVAVTGLLKPAAKHSELIQPRNFRVLSTT